MTRECTHTSSLIYLHWHHFHAAVWINTKICKNAWKTLASLGDIDTVCNITMTWLQMNAFLLLSYTCLTEEHKGWPNASDPVHKRRTDKELTSHCTWVLLLSFNSFTVLQLVTGLPGSPIHIHDKDIVWVHTLTSTIWFYFMSLTSMITSVGSWLWHAIPNYQIALNPLLYRIFGSCASTLQSLDNLYSAAGGMTPSFGILQRMAYFFLML